MKPPLRTAADDAALGLDCGRLAPGQAADVTISDPDLEWTYDVNQLSSKGKNSPLHGRRFRGGPIATIVDGRIV